MEYREEKLTAATAVAGLLFFLSVAGVESAGAWGLVPPLVCLGLLAGYVRLWRRSG